MLMKSSPVPQGEEKIECENIRYACCNEKLAYCSLSSRSVLIRYLIGKRALTSVFMFVCSCLVFAFRTFCDFVTLASLKIDCAILG